MVRIWRGYTLSDPLHATMFEDRRRLFVELMGWDIPVSPDGHEIDQFDGPDAVYLVAGDEEGAHAGSVRLLGTDRPHLLDTLFPMLVEADLPRGPGICEITRLCLPTRYGADERLRVRNLMHTALVDYCLATGIRTLTGVVRPAFRTQVLAMGWDASVLGPVREVGGMALGAFAVEIDADTPARLARNGHYGAALAASVPA